MALIKKFQPGGTAPDLNDALTRELAKFKLKPEIESQVRGEVGKIRDFLANLEKRDIPQFPQYGLDRELTKGMFEINLPLIIREKQKDFSVDDTILGFAINDISKNNGKLEIKFEVQSFFNTITNEIIKI